MVLFNIIVNYYYGFTKAAIQWLHRFLKGWLRLWPQLLGFLKGWQSSRVGEIAGSGSHPVIITIFLLFSCIFFKKPDSFSKSMMTILRLDLKKKSKTLYPTAGNPDYTNAPLIKNVKLTLQISVYMCFLIYGQIFYVLFIN